MALPRRTFKLNVNTGLVESRSYSSRRFLTGRSYFIEDFRQNAQKIGAMGYRARQKQFDVPSDNRIDLEDEELNAFFDAIGEMPSGQRTKALHGAFEAGDIPYPQVYDPEFNSAMGQFFQGGGMQDLDTFKNLMNPQVGMDADPNMLQQKFPSGAAKNFQLAMNKRGQDPRNANQGLAFKMGQGDIMQDLGNNLADQEVGDATNLYFGKQFANAFPNALANAENHDAILAKALDDEARDGGFYQDPDIDLDQKGKTLAAGMYGETEMIKDKDGNDAILKKGGIGPDEFKAFKALADNPHFPNLLNARIEKPFANRAQAVFNPMGRKNKNDLSRIPSALLGPGDRQAQGRYAMGLAPGEDLGEMGMFTEDGGRFAEDPQLMEEMQRQFWDIKGQMHKAGVAHNDLHAENIKYDEDNDMMHFIDMGLSEVDTLAAFREAMGGYGGGDRQTNATDRWEDMERQDGSTETYPLGAMMGGTTGFLPDEMQTKLDENWGKIEQMFEKKYGSRFDDENDFLKRDVHGAHFLKGGLREPEYAQTDNEDNFIGMPGRKDVAGMFGMIGDDGNLTPEADNELKGYIDQLYDGISFNPGERKQAKENLMRADDKINQMSDPFSAQDPKQMNKQVQGYKNQQSDLKKQQGQERANAKGFKNTAKQPMAMPGGAGAPKGNPQRKQSIYQGADLNKYAPSSSPGVGNARAPQRPPQVQNKNKKEVAGGRQKSYSPGSINAFSAPPEPNADRMKPLQGKKSFDPLNPRGTKQQKKKDDGGMKKRAGEAGKALKQMGGIAGAAIAGGAGFMQIMDRNADNFQNAVQKQVDRGKEVQPNPGVSPSQRPAPQADKAAPAQRQAGAAPSIRPAQGGGVPQAQQAANKARDQAPKWNPMKGEGAKARLDAEKRLDGGMAAQKRQEMPDARRRQEMDAAKQRAFAKAGMPDGPQGFEKELKQKEAEGKRGGGRKVYSGPRPGDAKYDNAPSMVQRMMDRHNAKLDQGKYRM